MRLPFRSSGKSRPPIIVEMTTEPLLSGPLNTLAVVASGRPATGTGLLMASRSSAEASLGPAEGRFRRTATRRVIALARAHGQPRLVDANFELPEAAIPSRVAGVVSQHVVRTVFLDQPVHRAGDVVVVDRREAARLVGHDPEHVLPKSDLVLESAAVQTQRLDLQETTEFRSRHRPRHQGLGHRCHRWRRSPALPRR